MLRVNVRQFNREMYSCLDSLPIIVYNKRTGVDLFKVLPIKGGVIRDIIQSYKKRS